MDHGHWLMLQVRAVFPLGDLLLSISQHPRTGASFTLLLFYEPKLLNVVTCIVYIFFLSIATYLTTIN